MGAVGAEGGTNLNSDNKFVPPPFVKPPPQSVWNEMLYPREYPLAYHEMSILLPHFLLEGRGKIAAYFTRVYNPVWTNPDGLLWERVLKDEAMIELHGALTPVWSETAQYADYVLPMGNGAERYDLMSQETHAGKWIGFRQPVQRVARERDGESFEFTHQANPGEVWEETEFWIELSWRIDPDGSLGVRRYFESPYRAGEKLRIQEYYRWIFENSVPGLPEAAAEKGLTAYEYMSKYGAFEVKAEAYGQFEENGFRTPSKKLELYSPTMAEWGWPEHALPGYIPSHVHRRHQTPGEFEFVLVPTFRLPTLIHTRSANAKWLYELSNANPVWIHTSDAERLGVETGDLVKVATRIGHYINRAWVTEAIRPGVVACSHHLGRWRLHDEGTDPMAGVKVAREELSDGVVRFRRLEDVHPYRSQDADTMRIWWTDGGVHQNLTFAVQPDPVSGQHCWHQRVVVTKAGPDDRYGDVVVDPEKSLEAYREWLALTRPASGPLRRPLWLDRAVRPSDEAYKL
jgi:anaerobic selenocysteine-containing dehydrogenase